MASRYSPLEVPQQGSIRLISLVRATTRLSMCGRSKLTSLQLPGFPMALLSHRKIMLLSIEPETQYAWFG